MKKLFPLLEHYTEPLLPFSQFLVRLAHSGAIALVFVIMSLFIGMAGYRMLEHLSWIDAFLNAAMLLGGMGPLENPATFAGKLFAGLYALYCGLAVIVITGICLTPVVHRILHRLHHENYPPANRR